MKTPPEIIRLKEVASTNEYVWNTMRKQRLPEGSVVWADYQTAGRGQAGNSWQSAAGENLTFSLVFYPESLPASKLFILSQITALSVKETIDEHTNDITVKWPNDIYWQNRKLGGILIENALRGEHLQTSVIGIGLNINQTTFDADAPNPISLSIITGRKYDCELFLRNILEKLYNYYYYLNIKEGELDKIYAAYHKCLYRRDGFFTYRDAFGQFEAKIVEVAPSGHIQLQLMDGSQRQYAFKEVEYVHS
ncbi:MAG: biotin--[acetyl-CoA-carboxylase] ligase [Tannerellaceae bacterium]|jgi:BirA family biotin operon repressor/biotin-[acetyl-CoA-carboxylase] ligase|nr:biotin--[acetyl-CoA-carboxylase] ligase [Tannerellaceae bacterium]